MGKRGPRATPKALKIARGTFRKDRAGDNALEDAQDCRPAPESLSEVARLRWEEFAPLLVQARVMKDSDWAALEQLCRAYQDVNELDQVIAECGRFQMTEAGLVINHPSVNQRQKALDNVRRYLMEFGMTPASRNSVKTNEGAASKITPRRRA